MMLANFAVVHLDPAEVARLDPGGPDQGPPEWWLAQWRQEFEESGPRPEPGPEPDETVASLAAYAAHRDRGLSPAAAAWATVHGPEPEPAEAEAG